MQIATSSITLLEQKPKTGVLKFQTPKPGFEQNNPGLETKIDSVVHLKLNYFTTKGVSSHVFFITLPTKVQFYSKFCANIMHTIYFVN